MPDDPIVGSLLALFETGIPIGLLLFVLGFLAGYAAAYQRQKNRRKKRREEKIARGFAEKPNPTQDINAGGRRAPPD